MKFSKDKLLKLLKEENSLQKKGKLLRDYNKEKYNELMQYRFMLDDQIFWNSRKKYIQILNLFIRKNITFNEFFTQFGSLRSSNLKSCSMLENNLENEVNSILDFTVNPESRGFTEIICDLYFWIDLYDSDVTLEMNLKNPEMISYGISEEFLRFRIETDFLPELEKYCNKA